MQRRTFLKGVTATGALLTAGCLGGAPTSGGASDETTTPEPAPVPESDIAFPSEGGVLRAVHMGGDQIEDADTTEVYVAVDGERTTTWVADDDETQPYPVSVGNFVEIEAAESGSTVEVVWVGRAGTESVLATHEVPAEETATETATPTETATANETTTTNQTTTPTTTTTANETVTDTTTTSADETTTTSE
ncbi:twin-arginine translocation signal domain-containing protein [Haloferax profundi]|uniref:Twin-arginine translocation signal domain-containing protein n=1 Tax=Haloferax profundi TaxID=1544718 RepID=A0A0W1SVD6_9EURY|nr:twin-arginine translocation signal domain-containing protein [Haloferax profundi]KTG30429.1 hypothetical protein AUR66_07915 [Haloferax profundi]